MLLVESGQLAIKGVTNVDFETLDSKMTRGSAFSSISSANHVPPPFFFHKSYHAAVVAFSNILASCSWLQNEIAEAAQVFVAPGLE